MKKTRSLSLIVLTPIFILLSHYITVFAHEYGHSFIAWLTGYKTNPFAIYYGGTDLKNILLLSNIDENVDYKLIFSLGHPYYGALIAFSGPGLANGLLFIISVFLLKKKKIKERYYLYYFLFWLNLMNLGNFYDYVPIRTFAPSGDIHNFIKGLSISPWSVYFFFGYIVAILIVNFFRSTLISVFLNLNITKIYQKYTITAICVCILFGFFGGFPYIYFLGPKFSGNVTYFT